jgi:hypothetical protein
MTTFMLLMYLTYQQTNDWLKAALKLSTFVLAVILTGFYQLTYLDVKPVFFAMSVVGSTLLVYVIAYILVFLAFGCCITYDFIKLSMKK